MKGESLTEDPPLLHRSLFPGNKHVFNNAAILIDHPTKRRIMSDTFLKRRGSVTDHQRFCDDWVNQCTSSSSVYYITGAEDLNVASDSLK